MKVLARYGTEGFSEVLYTWEGRTVVLIGGGPSLTLDQVAWVESAWKAGEVGVIAINDAYLLAPFADICYFADSQWWEWHTQGVARPTLNLSARDVSRRFAEFAGQKCSIQRTAANVRDRAVHVVRNLSHPDHSTVLSTDPKKIGTGRHSGFQAMNVATLAGAETLLLLGFDGRGPGNDRPSHWFGDHPRIEPAAAYEQYRKSFSAIEHQLRKIGARVINCSPGSWIDSFEKMDIVSALGLTREKSASAA